MAVVDRVRDLCLPILDELDLDLFDLQHEGGRLVVSVDRDGGVDMEVIAEATRRISRTLDEHDPVPGRYTLEVSSPGLERRLRTPDHYRWAVGRQVRVKARPGTDGDRRVDGVLVEVDDEGVTVRPDDPDQPDRRLAYDDVEKARTVFEWGPTPKPGGPKRTKGTKGKGARTAPTTSEPGGPSRSGRADRTPGGAGRRPTRDHDTEAKVES